MTVTFASSPAVAPATRLPLAAAFLQALHGAARDDAALAETLRDAGYAAGQALFDQFAEWLAAHGEPVPTAVADHRFGALFGEFLAADGWGTLEVGQVGDGVVTLTSPDWLEAPVHLDPAPRQPACHVTTGLWAGFFGRMADAPLAALEVECRASGDAHCRWLVASPDVLDYVFEAMERGTPWANAAESA
jgi:hypothetical protein